MKRKKKDIDKLYKEMGSHIDFCGYETPCKPPRKEIKYLKNERIKDPKKQKYHRDKKPNWIKYEAEVDRLLAELETLERRAVKEEIDHLVEEKRKELDDYRDEIVPYIKMVLHKLWHGEWVLINGGLRWIPPNGYWWLNHGKLHSGAYPTFLWSNIEFFLADHHDTRIIKLLEAIYEKCRQQAVTEMKLKSSFLNSIGLTFFDPKIHSTETSTIMGRKIVLQGHDEGLMKDIMNEKIGMGYDTLEWWLKPMRPFPSDNTGPRYKFNKRSNPRSFNEEDKFIRKMMPTGLKDVLLKCKEDPEFSMYDLLYEHTTSSKNSQIMVVSSGPEKTSSVTAFEVLIEESNIRENVPRKDVKKCISNAKASLSKVDGKVSTIGACDGVQPHLSSSVMEERNKAFLPSETNNKIFKRTKTYFMNVERYPPYKENMLNSFYDEFGFVQSENVIKWWEGELKQLMDAKDFTGALEFKQQNPRNRDQMYAEAVGTNLMPSEGISKQLIILGTQYKGIERVNLAWNDDYRPVSHLDRVNYKPDKLPLVDLVDWKPDDPYYWQFCEIVLQKIAGTIQYERYEEKFGYDHHLGPTFYGNNTMVYGIGSDGYALDQTSTKGSDGSIVLKKWYMPWLENGMKNKDGIPFEKGTPNFYAKATGQVVGRFQYRFENENDIPLFTSKMRFVEEIAKLLILSGGRWFGERNAGDAASTLCTLYGLAGMLQWNGILVDSNGLPIYGFDKKALKKEDNPFTNLVNWMSGYKGSTCPGYEKEKIKEVLEDAVGARDDNMKTRDTLSAILPLCWLENKLHNAWKDEYENGLRDKEEYKRMKKAGIKKQNNFQNDPFFNNFAD